MPKLLSLRYSDFILWAEKYDWLYLDGKIIAGNRNHIYLTPSGALVIVVVDITGIVLAIGKPTGKV